MATITGPLISLGARGTLAKTATFSSWRGRPYVRQRVIPANPRTTGQVEQRTLFAYLQALWKVSPALIQEVWTLAAKGLPITDRNSFSQKNLKAITRTGITLANILLSDGAKGGTPLVSASIVAAGGTITITPTTPPVPTGWTLTGVIGAAVRDVDPQTSVIYDVAAVENDVSPYHCAVTGLQTGDLYVWAAWVKWLKPDGTIAYSPQISGTATP